MSFIKSFIKFFVYITTGILLVAGIACVFMTDSDFALPKTMLLDVVLSGAVTSLVTAAVYHKEPETKRGFIILTIVHYLALCVVMVFIGVSFKWIDFTVLDVAVMMIYVAVVYAFTFFSRMFTDRKEADSINKALRNKYRDEE